MELPKLINNINERVVDDLKCYKVMEGENMEPKEMQSPFDEIKQTDATGKEWWNSRMLAKTLGYTKYWNFERLMEKVAQALQQEKGLKYDEHFLEIQEMAQLGSGTSRTVNSFLLSKTACLAIVTNADKRKPMVNIAKEYFTGQLSPMELSKGIESNVMIYRSSTGKIGVSVIFNQETFWLSQKRMAELFGCSVSTINYHLKQIDESGEIHLSDAVRKIRIPSDKWQEQGVLMYNLDVVIAVGYRVNSYEATQFRIWATQMLKESKEISQLERLSTAFIDFAEARAEKRILMKMNDWRILLEKFLSVGDCDILIGAGKVSHEDAETKALDEYKEFLKLQDKTFLSDFDKLIQNLNE